MDRHSRYRFSEDLWLDAQRAIWIESQRLLALADIHLGYAWVHRARGQLLPLAPDDSAQRLFALCQQYRPDRLVLAGDIVHGVASHPGVVNALQEVIQPLLRAGVDLLLVSGNHDRGLSELARRHAWRVQVARQFVCGGYRFLHGDSPAPHDAARVTVIGHEHPAIRLGDGVTASMKYPCFLLSGHLIVLPAFGTWASGVSVVEKRFMSDLVKRARFTKAVAVIGRRLLPVNLDDRDFKEAAS